MFELPMPEANEEAHRRSGPSPMRSYARLLSLLGLLPFLACMIIVWVMPPDYPYGSSIIALNLFYGAIIASFLSGIHWGVGLIYGAAGGREGDVAAIRLSWSVIPSLMAWLAIFPTDLFVFGGGQAVLVRYGILIAAFLLILLGDLTKAGGTGLPRWYGQMRVRLTFYVVSMLILVMIKVWLLQTA